MGDKKGRTDLTDQINQDLQSGGTPRIQATKHRDVLDSVNKSMFNLEDDNASQVRYDNSSSGLDSTDANAAIDEVNGKIGDSLISLMRGTVLVGDIGSAPANPPITGDIITAIANNTSDATEVIITFPDIGISEYFVDLELESLSVSPGSDDNLFEPVTYDKASDGVSFQIQEGDSAVQNIRVNISIHK